MVAARENKKSKYEFYRNEFLARPSINNILPVSFEIKFICEKHNKQDARKI
jgi:hypothetical protein